MSARRPWKPAAGCPCSGPGSASWPGTTSSCPPPSSLPSKTLCRAPVPLPCRPFCPMRAGPEAPAHRGPGLPSSTLSHVGAASLRLCAWRLGSCHSPLVALEAGPALSCAGGIEHPNVRMRPLPWAVPTALAQGWRAHGPAWVPRPGVCTPPSAGDTATARPGLPSEPSGGPPLR